MKTKVLNILLSLTILCFIIILLIIYRKSGFDFSNDQFQYLRKYFFISSIFAISSSIVIFLKNNIKLYFFIIFFSSIISLYLFEFYLIKYELRYQNELRKNLQIRVKNSYHDWRSKYQVYVDEIKKNNDISLKYIPSFFMHKKEDFALSGLSNSKTILCNESGYYATFISDRYGFNNNDEKWNNFKLQKDWVLIGDSAAIGECVFSKDNIASKIENYNDQLNVINLGNSGLGPLMKLAILKEYAEIIKPKKIIWIYIEDNDLIDIESEKNVNFLKNYLDINHSEKLFLIQKEIDEKITNIVKPEIDDEKYKKNIDYSLITEKFELKKFLKFKKIRGRFDKSTKYDLSNDLRYINNKEILIETWKSAVKLADTWSGQIYFVYFPEYLIFPNIYHPRRIEILKQAEKIFYDVIDIKEEFLDKEKTNLLKFYPYGLKNHFNELGYAKISEIIYNKLTNDN